MTQQTLPFVRKSRTSKVAAKRLTVSEEQRRQVLAFLGSCGDRGATDEEIQDGTGLGGSTERPRRVELERRGLIFKSELERPTRSGRNAAVWLARS